MCVRDVRVGDAVGTSGAAGTAGTYGTSGTSGKWHGGTRRDWLTAALICTVLALGGILDAVHPLTSVPLALGWAAALPWIVSGVGALASMYGANKASKAQNKVVDQQGQLTALQRDAAAKLMPYGEQWLKQGGAALTSLLPWYTKAALGDRNVLSQLVQPELRQIRENYDRPLQYLTEVSPRSGTTAASSAAILSGRADALNDALWKTRMAGMAGLQGIGGSLSDMGSRATGAAFGGLSGASSSNLGLLSELFNIRQQNSQQSQAAGAALTDFLRAYQMWNAGRTQTQPIPASTGNISQFYQPGVKP